MSIESDDESKKENEENSTEEVSSEEHEEKQMSMAELADLLAAQMSAAEEEERSLRDMRTVGLYGDVEEEKIAELIAGLLSLHHLGKPKPPAEGEEQEEGRKFARRRSAGVVKVSHGAGVPRSL